MRAHALSARAHREIFQVPVSVVFTQHRQGCLRGVAVGAVVCVRLMQLQLDPPDAAAHVHAAGQPQGRALLTRG
eukprot:6214036-Pleurochrysis_carterae.AAC.1